jgi:hypothetical protein
MPVKSMLVPLVLATAVPDTILLFNTDSPPAPCMVDGAVAHVPAVACVDSTNPTTRNGTDVLAVVE